MTLSGTPINASLVRRQTRRLRWERRHVITHAGVKIAAKSAPIEHTYVRNGVTCTKVSPWYAVPWYRTCACGNANKEFVTVAYAGMAKTDDPGYAYISQGVNSCAAVWLCPPCAAKIRRQRTDDVKQLALWNAARGGELGMLTLTLGHTAGDELRTLVEGLCEALRRFQRSVLWETVKDLTDGTVRALEVTHGFGPVRTANGWHPHFHLLFVIPPGANASGDTHADVLEQFFKSWGYREWANCIVAELGEKHRPSIGRGFDYKRIPPDAAVYVAKISQEITRGDLKSAARQPWEIIDRMAAGSKRAVAQWTEYAIGMKGKSSVRWSPGLRDLAGMAAELTDQEIMETLVDDGEDALEVPRKEWQTAKRARVQHMILERVEDDAAWCAANGIDWQGGGHDWRHLWLVGAGADPGG